MTWYRAAAVAALALAGAALTGYVLVGCAGPDPAEHRTIVPLAALPAAATGPGTPVREVPAGRLDQARPVRLSVPAIGLAVPTLTELHRDAGGLLQMPSDPATAGWSTVGPTPGGQGPAVITADATGLFGRLGELVPGDEVSVDREDGTHVVFTVYRVARFDRATFPGDEVWGDTPRAELRLVTSGGVFDRGADPSAGNVVAFARLAGVR